MRNDIKKLKKQLESIKKANSSIYLKLNDCIYKTVGAGEIVEVDSIPDGATVEEVGCSREHFVYLFTANGKPYWTEIISVSEAIKRGEL